MWEETENDRVSALTMFVAPADRDTRNSHKHVTGPIQEVLYERTRLRAYFLHLNEEGSSSIPPDSERSEHFWKLAEQIEQESLFRHIQERAYFLWLEECHRTWDTVIHKNDWCHWFLAEREVVDQFRGRKQIMTNSADIDVPSSAVSAGNATVETSACAEESLPLGYGDSKQHEGSFACCQVSESANNGVPDMTDGKDATQGRKTRPFRKNDQVTSRVVESNEPCEVTMSGSDLDYSKEEFIDKLIVTDSDELEILAIAKTFEELDEIVGQNSFREKLRSLGKGGGEYLIHHGRSSRSL